MLKPNKRYRGFMTAQSGDYADIDTLEKKVLAMPDCEYMIMLHDKDTGNDHAHVSLYFKNARTIKAVAKDLDTPENFIKAWDMRKDNLWAYLIHNTDNAKGKKASYADYVTNPKKCRTNLTNPEQYSQPIYIPPKIHIDELLHKVRHGELKYRQLLSPEYIDIYDKYYRRIEQSRRIYEASLVISPPSCTTTLITGLSGSGKTTKAQLLATQLTGDDYTTASSDNDMLQDYHGEKCLIIDDFRPQNIDWINLLGLLDPTYRSRTHKSRYYNKPLATEYIILTSVLTLEQIENYYMTIHREDLKQLRRRIQTVIHMENFQITKQLYYNDDTDDYDPIII